MVAVAVWGRDPQVRARDVFEFAFMLTSRIAFWQRKLRENVLLLRFFYHLRCPSQLALGDSYFVIIEIVAKWLILKEMTDDLLTLDCEQIVHNY